jgi:hypothetical protein
MKADQVPAVAVGVVRQGKLVYGRGFGVRSVEDRGVVDADTLFRIGSTTKPLTGTAVMRLVQAGFLAHAMREGRINSRARIAPQGPPVTREDHVSLH